jgi:hypothetical protein
VKQLQSPRKTVLFVFLEIQHPLKLQAFDLLQRPTGDALQVAVHTDGGLHDAVDLFFAFGPLAGDGFLSRSKSYFIDEKSIDDRPQLGDGRDCLRMFFSLMLLDVVQQLIDGQMREIVLSPALIVEWFTGHEREEAQRLYGAEFVGQGLGGLFS